MSDTDSVYGSGLNFTGIGPGSLPDAPADSGADVPSGPAGAPTSLAPPSGTAPDASPTFGSAFKAAGGVLGAPQYTAPDPKTSALDQTASLLQQRIDRANQVATNPVLQFFNPQGVQAARDAVPQLTTQLQQLKTQQQQQTDIQATATNYGMPKSAQNPMMTNDTIDNWLLDQYKGGDFSKANALRARGKGDWVTDFAGQAVDGAGQKLQAASTVADRLNAAQNSQAAYDAVRKSLTPQDVQALSAIGLQTIPPKVADWQNINSTHGAQFAQAQQMHAQVQQKLNNITNFDGTLPKDVEAASQGDVQLGSTNEPAGFPVRTRSIDGQTGSVAPNGSVITENYGLSTGKGGWSAWTPEREKTLQGYFADPDTKGAVSQYNIANKFKHEALDDSMYTSSAGLALLKDTLGGVGRDVAESSAAAGSIGLTKMFANQQGGFEGWLNKAQSELGAYQNWLDNGKKGAEPRISDTTKQGLQAVASSNYDFALKEAQSRLGGAMTYAGQGGKPLDQIPLDPDLKADMASYHEAGRMDAINGFRAHPSLVRGSQRIFFPQGATVNGAQPPRAPIVPGQQPAATQQQNPQAAASAPTVAPGAGGNPPAGPAQPASLSSGPPSAAPGPAGGSPSPAPAPTTVAGQQVNVSLPPGASPAYVNSLQRVETGGSKTPWTQGTPASSASGAFQAVDSTWNQYKPPGAPARASMATPQQQADFLTNVTKASATALQAAKVPVNDTSLYVTHNLGVGAGPKLLTADPNADARKVVGDAAANNNPMFFKGKPTVAVALARYQHAMAPPAGAPGAPSPPISQPAPGETNQPFVTGRTDIPGGETDAVQKAVANAPVIGGLAGSAVGGPVGGAVGGGAGQALQNYMNGEDVLQPNVVGSAAFGAAGGIETAGLKGAAVRAGVAAGGGSVEGGMEGGVRGAVSGAINAGVGAAVGEGVGAGGAAVTDRFGGFLGMSGHQTFSRLTPDAQKAYLDAANTVAKGKPEKPVAVAGVANPAADQAYQDKLDAYDAASDHLKAVLPHVKPEEAAYAAQQVAGEPAATGDAVTGRPLAAEEAAVGAGYQQLRSDVAAAGDNLNITSVKGGAQLADGPVSQLRTADNPSGAISDKYGKEMQDAEMLATAPAPSPAGRWDNLLKARSELLQQERTAIGGPAPDTNRAKAMRAGADALYPEIERTAQSLFGVDGAKPVLQRLNSLDTRYARVMKLSENGDVAGTIASGGEAGRQASVAYKALAADDPMALRTMNALVRLKQGVPWREVGLMVPVIASEIGLGAPGMVSGPLAITKLTQLLRDYTIKRGAGQPVKMDTLIQKSRTAANSNVTPATRVGAIAGAAQGAAAGPRPGG